MEPEEKKELQELQNKVKEFDLDELLRGIEKENSIDLQRREIEEVARVIVTPTSVEIYTFDDKVFIVEMGGTITRAMKFVEKEDGSVELEPDVKPN